MRIKLITQVIVSFCLMTASTKANTQKPVAKKFNQIDTSSHPVRVNWSRISASQIEIKKSGQEAEVLPNNLLAARILPNQASKQVIHALNKDLSNNQTVTNGSIIKLPVFVTLSETLKTQFNQQYSNDLAVDENANAVFVSKIDNFNKMLALTTNIPGSEQLNLQLNDVKRVFAIVQKLGPDLKIRSFQIKMLNNELEDFNDSLLAIVSRQTIEKRQIEDSKYFNEDMCNLINPLLGNAGIKRTIIKRNTQYFTDFKKMGGPFQDMSDGDDFETEEITDNVEPALPVCFYVFEADGSPSTIPYDVYCVPQRAYNQFKNNQRSLQSLDSYKALGKASVAYKTLETSFPRYFFAVSGNTKSEVQFFEVYDIPKDPHNSLMTEPYSFPIYLQKNN